MTVTRSKTIRAAGRRLKQLLLSALKRDLVKLKGTGVTVRVDPLTPFGADLVRFGSRPSEPFFIPLLKEVLRPGDVMVELGAHWGIYSTIGCELVGDEGKVVAVEPYRPSFDRLVDNAQRNGFGNLVPVFSAVAAKTADGVLLVDSDEHNLNRLSAGGDTASASHPGAVQECPTTTLSGLVERLEIDRIRFMKIDIEGGEYEILGDVARNAGRIEFLLIELHPPYSDGDSAVEAFYRMLGGDRRLYSFSEIGRKLEIVESISEFKERITTYYFLSCSEDAAAASPEITGLRW